MSVENEPERETAGTVPALVRETILPNGDRGRVATLVAMCSLAGVAVGFGLSTAAMQAASEARTVVITDVRSVPVDREIIAGDETPWLGVRFHSSALDGNVVGATIDEVVPGSPAPATGLHIGDIIVGYEHQPVHNSADLFRMVRGSSVGDHPSMQVLRASRPLEVRPELASVPIEFRTQMIENR